MHPRNKKLLGRIDYINQVGVEIGALNRPIVTPQMGDIRYVDHASTESIKAKYADDPSIDINQIVTVDYVWGEQSLAQLMGNDAPFDYLIASHVIEHVPDLVGWLEEIRSILKTGGILSLAIPDKQQCFDYQRNVSRLCEVLEAYLNHNRRPTARQIFDQLSLAVQCKGEIAWRDRIRETSDITYCDSLENAWAETKAIFEAGNYRDVHCWVFTPRSLLELLKKIAKLNLLKFEIVEFYNTTDHEFFVTLRAIDTPNPDNIQEFIDRLTQSASLPDYSSIQSMQDELLNLNRQLQIMENTRTWKIRSLSRAILGNLKRSIVTPLKKILFNR